MGSSDCSLRRASVSNRDSGMNFPEGSGDEQSPEEPDGGEGLPPFRILTTLKKGATMVVDGRKGKLRNYRRFLVNLEQELAECLREAENSNWHHSAQEGVHWFHYTRLCTWLDEVHDRMEWYDAVKAKKVDSKRATPSGGVVRHAHQRDDRDG